MNRALATKIKECAGKAKVSIVDIANASKHIRVVVKGKKQGLVFVSVSASDRRAFLNVVTDMRKAGYAND